jgi:hypothetical protein
MKQLAQPLMGLGFFQRTRGKRMNLQEMRNMVASILDYDPDVQSYRDEINRFINESYRNWFVSRPYVFSQKTVDIYSMPDCDLPATANIQGSNANIRNFINIGAALSSTDSTGVGFVNKGFFNSHEGSIIIVSGDDETSNNGTFIIDKIDFDTGGSPAPKVYVSRMSSTPQVDWSGTVATVVAGSVQQRYITLPNDCVDLLGVQIRNIQETTDGTNALGKIYNLTRRRDEELNLRYDLTGTPTEYIMYDGYPEHTVDIDQFLPRQGKDFFVDTASNTPGWPQGTYEFKMSYVWRGVESQLSDAQELKISASNTIPRFNTEDTTRQGFQGLRKKFYVRLKSVTGKDSATHEEKFFRDLSTVFSKTTPNGGAGQYKYYLIDDDETQTNWSQSQIQIDANNDLYQYAREGANLGNRQRIRLYPRPAASTPIEARYIYMPTDLLEDNDIPKAPDDTHRYLVYRTCADTFMKHNNPDMADFYDRKAEKELLKIDNKYLTQRSALYIKENFIAGPLRIKPYQSLTRLPDA